MFWFFWFGCCDEMDVVDEVLIIVDILFYIRDLNKNVFYGIIMVDCGEFEMVV